ncbi:E3 ubiquitin-protein ligase TRIM39-like isoform X1 [Hemitrygon akajei]|uniref:E3 ubiquitin-protein ligase TRIM39-like isoform X1 n=1 Tax=Hemitrygon akajei TaxID=2704970 RepID=UPI003BFA1B22
MESTVTTALLFTPLPSALQNQTQYQRSGFRQNKPITIPRLQPLRGHTGSKQEVGLFRSDLKQEFPSRGERTEMASADFVQELTCSICLEVFTEPVSLDCGHNFCRACISEVWEKVSGDVSCPQCRQEFVQRNTRPAYILSNIAEQVRHLRVGTAERTEEFVCREHNEKLKLFCLVEQEMICLVCSLSAQHKMHNVIPIKEAAQALKEKLEESLKFLKVQMNQSVRNKQEGEAAIRGLKDQVDGRSSEIRAEFEKMHQFLREKQQQMEAELRREADQILTQLEKNLKRTVNEISSLEEVIQGVKVRLRIQDPQGLLKDIQALLKRCELPVSRPGVVSVDLPEDVAEGRLRYLKVWKEMRAVVSPVPERLTLDPDTSQNNLILSQDLMSVKYLITEQSPQDHPKRFEKILNVLSSQGFTSGRHYWEVYVGYKTEWVVGVCRESVSRDRDHTYTPAEGYWVIYVFSNLIKMGNVISHLEIKLQKLGVYLDYERGQVSFYNADNMCHLHTYTDSFTEKLHLILNPCDYETGDNSEPLTLLTT